MITCSPTAINATIEKDFRKWLSQPQFNTLLQLLSAKCQEFQVKALNDASEGGGEGALMDRAKAHFEVAGKYSTAVELLKALAEQSEPYSTVKLT